MARSSKRTLSPPAQRIALDSHHRRLARHDPSLSGAAFEFRTKREMAKAIRKQRRTFTDRQLGRYYLAKPQLLGTGWRRRRFSTADQLLATCPSAEDMETIRADFNIWFEGELIDEGVLVPWACTNGGGESSLMLTMYNAFRLMGSIPFSTNLPWAAAHNNVYDWLKKHRSRLHRVHLGRTRGAQHRLGQARPPDRERARRPDVP